MRIIGISTPNTHSQPINKPLVNEIMGFSDIIYRNNNYLENLHTMGNNESKNIIFIQQFYIPKQYPFVKYFSLSDQGCLSPLHSFEVWVY